MTYTEKVVCSIYTGTIFGDGDELFDGMLRYAVRLLGRPVGIHEFSDPGFQAHLHDLSTEDFTKIYRDEPMDFVLEERKK